MRKSKRSISKSKTYGFNPWVDQVDAINQVMDETGEKAESVVLRKLIDEALSARRRKRVPTVESEPPSIQEGGETFRAVQTLLLELVRQGETSLRIQDLSLALLQDVLAEARGGREATWQLRKRELTEGGLNSSEIEKRFAEETAKAKNYAYGLAEELKKNQATD